MKEVYFFARRYYLMVIVPVQNKSDITDTIISEFSQLGVTSSKLMLIAFCTCSRQELKHMLFFGI